MTAWVPAGWPEEVRPPGAEGWEQTAATYLLDCCPADFRLYPLLRRHPVVLARFAAEFVDGQQQAMQHGLADNRTGLAAVVPPEVVQQAAEMWQEQSARLARVRRGVGLLEEALRGRQFVRPL